ncbi:LapD/MoxY N-terminal periplasmic domain-containing protein [Motilimonas pumila]|uniref:LapD/MoxY periplasmic domain-containing protein n=1 Tax=Motilimonas pumila TaxID=2303987 RepID=A0A418YBF9_9GAMM|nr:LapD/MoxY N-terminal periplasmic domain-containing protein [Motilimonas pumila]RJG40311.1 hypothetical protein D1Z90_16280 [Motilimonas pumila]
MLRLLGVSLVLAIINIALFAGLFYLQGASLADQLTLQFQQNMESSLTALGLILQNTLLGGDVVMAETIINAMFDGSVLQSVSLYDLDGELVFERAFAEPHIAYPEWLGQLFPPPEMHRTMEMTDGWNILGDLKVSSHQHHLYKAMWQVLTDRFLMYLLLMLTAWALQVKLVIYAAKKEK